MVSCAVVITILRCDYELWTQSGKDLKKFESFQRDKLWQILDIKWQDRRANNEVLNRSEMPSIGAAILKHCLRWSVHVNRITPSRYSRTIIYSELFNNKQHCGATKHLFKDQLRPFLFQAEISPNDWKTEAAHRPSWRRAILFVCSTFEEKRKTKEEVKKKKETQGLATL